MMDRTSGRLIGSPANNADRAALSAFVKSEAWTCAWYDRVNLARLMPICPFRVPGHLGAISLCLASCG